MGIRGIYSPLGYTIKCESLNECSHSGNKYGYFKRNTKET